MKQLSKRISIPPESETVEWKQSLGEWEEIVETCAAFATAQGGTIYIGIRPNGEYLGVQIGKGTIEDLVNKIKLNTDPPQFPTIITHGEESSSIVEITVKQNPVKPVWAFGRPMKRVGRTNQMLKREETQRLLEGTTGRTWDALACPEFKVKDINQKAVRDFLDRSGMRKSTPIGDVIRNLRFGDVQHLCNAAVLLFGKFPQRFFVEAKVKCARFIGGSQTHFLDERTIEGPILRQLDEAMAFVTRNTRQAIVITGKPERDIVPEYPETAVREAITNALCHRSYTDVGTIQVRIHDDRMEVWNPGSLPADLSLGALYGPHGSYPRNPLLASAVFRSRLIEQWGTGTLRIIEACLPRNIKVEFELAMGMFIVRLKQPATQNRLAEEKDNAGRVIPKAQEAQVKAQEAQVLSAVEQRMLVCCARSPIAGKSLLKDAGYVTRTGNFKRSLAKLIGRKFLEMTIPDKPNSRLQKYRITEKGTALLRRGKK